jgi:hypothetical protein
MRAQGGVTLGREQVILADPHDSTKDNLQFASVPFSFLHLFSTTTAADV